MTFYISDSYLCFTALYSICFVRAVTLLKHWGSLFLLRYRSRFKASLSVKVRMGVPSFYRWLAQKYPLIIVDAVEEEATTINGVEIPLDSSKPNPNNMEFDNLYLDMNGIIHPCFHPEDRPSPLTYEDVFKNMFDYIDRIFRIVRPRKLLYMAIDGVAPRAKMNQQRSRRFRAAKDAADAAAEEEKLRKEFEEEGRKLPPKVESQVHDSNVITPGTEFMETLSVVLQYYIHLRLNHDSGWRNVKVILSDANVPGEGEHKIMSFIRMQRNKENYDPNTRHCLYGLDADLIMLGLATHEVHFSILREVITDKKEAEKCFICGQIGHKATNCDGKRKRESKIEKEANGSFARTPYQFLNIWTLREYLELDMKIPNPPFEIDFERLVDDFVFICFFVGNDFLPHMPTLEIREGAINLLMTVYKKEFNAMGGYLTNSSEVHLSNAEHFLQAVGTYEDSIFKKRSFEQKRSSEIAKQRSSNKKAQDLKATVRESSNSVMPCKSNKSEASHSSKLRRISETDGSISAAVEDRASAEDEEDLKFKIKMALREKEDLMSSGGMEEDKVKLGDAGWKERYYAEKFQAHTEEEREKIREDIVSKYTEGLCWVMQYYYNGVSSWNWFYPYHYAPFASDFTGVSKLNITFSLGKPFKPFNQLLGVLPAASAQALPVKYRALMMDPNSPVIDFYPSDFEIDLNGKRFAWQGVAKLPFIDETRLLDAVKNVEGSLTEREKLRNSTKFDILFVYSKHGLAQDIYNLYKKYANLSQKKRAKLREVINPKSSEGLNGYMSPCHGAIDACPPKFTSPINKMEDIINNSVLSVIFRLGERCSHIPRPLEGVVMPKQTVYPGHMKPTSIWHDEGGQKERIQNRAPVKGSLQGPFLAEAALRLVNNCLQGKFDSFLKGRDMVSEAKPKKRPAGPVGYEKGFVNQGSEQKSSGKKANENGSKKKFVKKAGGSGNKMPDNSGSNKRKRIKQRMKNKISETNNQLSELHQTTEMPPLSRLHQPAQLHNISELQQMAEVRYLSELHAIRQHSSFLAGHVPIGGYNHIMPDGSLGRPFGQNTYGARTWTRP